MKTCACCGKPQASQPHCAGCCLVTYCSRECQRNDWTTHKPTCKIGKKIRALNVSILFDFIKNMLLIAAENYTECVQIEGKGRGIVARKLIPAGTDFAFIIGNKFSPMELTSMKQWEYYVAATVVGDTSCIPDHINGSFLNDCMTLEMYCDLCTGNLIRFTIHYLNLMIEGTASPINITTYKGVGCETIFGKTAKVDIQPGTEICWFYGFDYWLQMLASGNLPNSTIEAVVKANELIMRGNKEFHDAVTSHIGTDGKVSLPGGTFDIHEIFYQKPSIPVWVQFIDNRFDRICILGSTMHILEDEEKGSDYKSGHVLIYGPWVPRSATPVEWGWKENVKTVTIIIMEFLKKFNSDEDKSFLFGYAEKLFGEISNLTKDMITLFSKMIVEFGNGDQILKTIDKYQLGCGSSFDEVVDETGEGAAIGAEMADLSVDDE